MSFQTTWVLRCSVAILIGLLSGCSGGDSAAGDAALSDAVLYGPINDIPENAKYASALKRTLYVCQIPREGVRQPPGGSIHAAHVYFLLGDIDAAAESLESGRYPISDEQEFFLLSYSVLHENDRYLNVLLDAGLDPKAAIVSRKA